jgi:hypothetical protein
MTGLYLLGHLSVRQHRIGAADLRTSTVTPARRPRASYTDRVRPRCSLNAPLARLEMLTAERPCGPTRTYVS